MELKIWKYYSPMKDLQLKSKTFNNFLKELVKPQNLYFISFGLVPLLFKYFLKYNFIILLIALLSNEFICKAFKKLRKEQKDLRLIFSISFIFSFVFNSKIVGVIIIFNTIIDRVTGLFRRYYKLNKFFKTGKNYSGIIFFWFFGIFLNLIYIYFLQNYILKSDIIALFFTGIILGLIESTNPLKLSDNLSISILAPFLFFIGQFIDFKIHIDIFNFFFSFLICSIFLVVLVLLDIIKFKDVLKAGVLLLILYNGLNYRIFVFHILLIIGYSFLIKIEFKNTDNPVFLNFLELMPYFILSFIISLLLFISPVDKFIKLPLSFASLTMIFFHSIKKIDKLYGKKYFNFNNFKISLYETPDSISIQALLITASGILIYLLIGFFLKIFRLIEIPFLFFLSNLILLIFKYLILKFKIDIIRNEVKFLLTYLTFLFAFITNYLIKYR